MNYGSATAQWQAPIQAQIELQFMFRRPREEWRGPVEYAERRAKEWREYWAKLPREIPIEHDPEWRNRFWSIQNAHDANTTPWKVARSGLGAMGVMGLASMGTLGPLALLPVAAWIAIESWPKGKSKDAQ